MTPHPRRRHSSKERIIIEAPRHKDVWGIGNIV
jgi:hypothetical protein